MTGKTTKEREYGEPMLSLHHKVKEAVDNALSKEHMPCVLVSNVEKDVGADPRTLKLHLKLLEESGYGKLSNDGKLFCLAKKEENKPEE